MRTCGSTSTLLLFGRQLYDTDLLANLHVLLEAVHGFPGDNGTGGTHNFTSLGDCSLPLAVRNSTLENVEGMLLCQLANHQLLAKIRTELAFQRPMNF